MILSWGGEFYRDRLFSAFILRYFDAKILIFIYNKIWKKKKKLMERGGGGVRLNDLDHTVLGGVGMFLTRGPKGHNRAPEYLFSKLKMCR